MVMHARKPQRINDGYFEKHQTHPYQNSKYSSSKGSYEGRYNHERMRDSPNGNSYRSDSPDSQSPRDRSYQNKSMYLQKIREKERENRDYKPREKYSDCARSPKDKRNRDNRDSEHRTNHDRSSAEEKRDDRERIIRVGDWSEHISSSGKKYYYNCKTEVSQWEKPREWIKSQTREPERSYSISRTGAHDKHSNSRSTLSNSREMIQKSTLPNLRTEKRDLYWNSSQTSGSREEEERRKHLDGESQAQDMDISPGGSTPTSETSYSHSSAVGGSIHIQQNVVPENQPQQGPVLLASALPRITPHYATPGVIPAGKSPQQTLVAVPVTSANTPGPPVSISSLPRLLSQIVGSKGLEQQEQLSPVKTLQTIQTALLLSRQTNSSADVPITAQTPALTEDRQVPPNSLQPLKVDTGNNATVTEGPPTPTHSESQDCVDARKLASPPSSLSSLQSLAQAGSSLHALRPQGPHLTPSLANHYRDDLVNHVRGWPAEVLEKQSQKLSEEGHAMGSLQCTRVSADLKTARSLVRLTEIQATLHEQRILFLRQQIKMLEELKSQNSFMADDS